MEINGKSFFLPYGKIKENGYNLPTSKYIANLISNIIINYYYIRVQYTVDRGLENDGFQEFIAAHYRISINVKRRYGNG